MENIKKLEDKIGEWLKPFPHLPENWRKWIAENSWWLVIVGLVLTGLAVFSMLGLLLLAFGLTVAFVPYAVAATGINLIVMLVAFAALAAEFVIYLMAINPLKAGKRKGWDLMFLAFLVGIASNVIGLLSEPGGIISVAVGAIIGAYVLFELKPYFVKS